MDSTQGSFAPYSGNVSEHEAHNSPLGTKHHRSLRAMSLTEDMYLEQMPPYELTSLVTDSCFSSFSKQDEYSPSVTTFNVSPNEYATQTYSNNQGFMLGWNGQSTMTWTNAYAGPANWVFPEPSIGWSGESGTDSALGIATLSIVPSNTTAYDSASSFGSPSSPPAQVDNMSVIEFDTKETKSDEDDTEEEEDDDDDDELMASTRPTRYSRGPRRRRTAMVRFEGGNPILELDDMESDEMTGSYQLIKRPQFRKHKCRFTYPDGHKCQLRFHRPEHLKRHQQVHTGSKRFRCEICSRLFSRRDNCRDHYWTHVKRPGRRGRNDKFPIAKIAKIVGDKTLVQRLERRMQEELREEALYMRSKL